MISKKENIKEYDKKYTEPFGKTDYDGSNNMLLSQNIYRSLGDKTNNNVLVIGDANYGSTHSFFASNLLQANCSYVVHDRGGVLYRQYAGYLEHKGYTVKCLNLVDAKKSNYYNPFRYIHSDKDIPVLVDALLKNTTRLDKSKGDHFMFKAETALLMAIIAYLNQFCSPNKQNFSGVIEFLRTVDISSITDISFSSVNDIYSSIDMSPLNDIFDTLNPDSLAAKCYMDFRLGAGRTMQENLVSCIFRLQAFDIPDIAALTKTDNIDLETISDEKTAVFVITPTDHDDFNFLAAIMISQIFKQAYDYCGNISEYSWLVLNGDDQVIRTFQANNEAEAEEALKKAEKFLSDAKCAEVIYKENSRRYEATTKEGDMIFHRGAKEDAEKELSLICDGGHISQSRYRLPVKTMFLLDDSAFLGKIHQMDYRIATCRGYNMSIAMGLYTLRQLKDLYRYDWDDIAGNCGSLIYTGAEDPETAKWLSARIGEMGYKPFDIDENKKKILQLITKREEKPVWEKTIQGKAPINITGCKYTPAQLQQLPIDECIILQRNTPTFRDLQCIPEKHPAYSLATSLAPFGFNT